jgi:hypothetical protein
LTGFFSGLAAFDGNVFPLRSRGHYDSFVAKLGKSGKPAWATAMGAPDGHDVGQAIAIDHNGDVVATGRFKGSAVFGKASLHSKGLDDTFITKLSAKGDFVWTRQGGGTGDDRARDLLVDDDNGVLVSGVFEDTAQFGASKVQSAGNADCFVAKYSADGKVRWARRYGGPDQESAGFYSGDENTFMLAGSFSGGAGGKTRFGSHTLVSNGWYDIFLVKLAQDGHVKWAVSLGGAQSEAVSDLIVDDNGNIYITGYFEGKVAFAKDTLASVGETDIFVAKLDRKGAVVWARQVGGIGYDYGEAIGLDSSGNIYVAGEFEEKASFSSSTSFISMAENDAFIASYTSSGDLRWARSTASTGFGECRDLVVLSRDVVITTGFFSGTATFGKTTLTSRGLTDVFVWKLTVP